MEPLTFDQRVATYFAMRVVGKLEKTSYPLIQFSRVRTMKGSLELAEPYVLHRVIFEQKDSRLPGEIVVDVCLTNNVVDGDWTGGYLIVSIPGDGYHYYANITEIYADSTGGKGILTKFVWRMGGRYSFNGKDGTPGFPSPIQILKINARSRRTRLGISLA